MLAGCKQTRGLPLASTGLKKALRSRSRHDIVGRYPFLLVDRVVECDPGKSGVGYKYLSANEDFFNGHFPGRPIMPGVLQVEALAQLGGLVLLPTLDASARDKFFFGGIDNCKFKRPVVPGDCLMMKVEVIKFNPRFGICKLAGKAYVGEQVTCEAELTVVIVK